MASDQVREKLKQLLKRGTSSKTFSEDIVWLQSLQSWINFHCPTLQTFLVKGISIAWLIIYPSPEKTEQIGQAEVRLVINVDKSFELQILKKVVKQQDITERESITPILAFL